MTCPNDDGPVSDDDIGVLFRAYMDPSCIGPAKKEALERLLISILRMEVRYISKLAAHKSESQIDIDDLSNHVTQEFWERYLVGKIRKLGVVAKVVPLLKKMARSFVINAVRDSERLCRHPDETETEIVHSDRIESVEDKRSVDQPSDRLQSAELVGDLESKLADPNLWPVYRMMIEVRAAPYIAVRLNWDLRTAERLMSEVRIALRPYCEANLGLHKDTKNEIRNTKYEKGEGRSDRLRIRQ